jgi:hypothetical protein
MFPSLPSLSLYILHTLTHFTCRPVSESHSATTGPTVASDSAGDKDTTSTAPTPTPAVQLSDLQSILSNMAGMYGKDDIKEAICNPLICIAP